ncbi:DNA-directed DNA polymerase [Cooperia oncophora]
MPITILVVFQVLCCNPCFAAEKTPISPLAERNSPAQCYSAVKSTPAQCHPSIKRARQPVMVKSPSTASPLTKNLRTEKLLVSAPPSTDLEIDDVCRTESAWNYFTQRSSLWNKIGVALATRRTSASLEGIQGICLCPIDGSPHFIPLTEEYFPGNDAEEAVCPSSTPSQSISLEERVSCISMILQSCELYLIDALQDCHLLRRRFKLKSPRVRCVSYMAFLGHMRRGDHVLPLHEIAAKFPWSFDCASLLRMNPRIASGAEAYLASRCTYRLESFRLEMRSLQVLFCRLKLACPGGSSTKRHLSTNKAILEQMKTQHPVVANILQYRRFKHALTQCIVPMQYFVDDDGCVLISADYSQLELRVLAHLSGDPALVEILKGGQDVFTDMSRKLVISRDTAKKLCYGVIYGMGAKTLAETVNKSVEEADKLIRNFFQSFPKVRTYINNTKEQAVKAGFVTTILGRRRVTCSARGRQEDVARDDRQSINYTIQGTASEIFKRAIVALDESRKGATRIVMTVHDEIIVECALDKENGVKQWMRSCMENVFPDFLVPLPVKIRSGPNWGSLS